MWTSLGRVVNWAFLFFHLRILKCPVVLLTVKTFGFFSFFSFKCLDFYVNIRNVLFSNRPVSKSSNRLYSMRLLSMLFYSCCYSSIKILSLKITRSHSVQNRIWICRKFFTAASQDICNLNSLCGWFVSWASYSIFHKGWNSALKENTYLLLRQASR